MTDKQFAFIHKVRSHWFLRNLFCPEVLDFIACQFALESNFGTSRLAQCQNNYCGMRVPFRRVFYGFGDGDFASYDSFDMCIIDYCSWVFYNLPYQNVICDLSAFRIFLTNTGYCPEKGYIDKINLIYQQLKNYSNE